ncbi:transcription factor IIIC subunit delta N-term-domain-containing protein [Mycena albidolilacea]|uniref:Transcription factor IIIC subunit delta N-term-domain-containing protein n=1 Tax=Mycena albidolilacea TaxID=1033008 RepID=A0AAD6Z5N5_9AGAR|nr:transcription factor IIIC subunit delta N-term-domain-containing protein [Mycena albidolilacea]
MTPPAPTYSTLAIPTVTSRPSLSCLQWSGDGQVFFLSKGSVYILTPDCGILSMTQLLGDISPSHIKWFSTMIDFNPRDFHNWPAASQEWGALALGSMDVGLRAMSCSPSNLTGNGGCVAAILSSNMDLSLWHAAKNTIKGEWAKLCEVTPFIADLASREPHSNAEQTIKSQTTSLLWSSHADFDVTPAPCVDSSLLVTGTRAGTLMLFRFKDASLEHVVTTKVSAEWITHLALSFWSSPKAGESEITLAFGAADGSVGSVKIIQTLSSAPSSSGFCLDYTVETRVEKSDSTIFPQHNTGITALSWIFPGENRVLVRTTPGVVSLWSGVSPTLGWSGRRSLRLDTQKLSVGSSSLQPVSGLHYAQQEDALFVSLFDGSVHVINSLSEEPKLSNASQTLGDQTSEGLSDILRSTFVRSEKAKISKRDMNRVSGMIPCDDHYSVAVWVQESAQPSNFDYKYDVLHESTLIGKRFPSFLRHSISASGCTPLALLRPIFLHLEDLLKLQPRVIQILLAEADRYPPSPVLPTWSGDVDPQLRLDFRRSLKQHLYGCNILHSARLKLAVAEFCWASRLFSLLFLEYGQVAQQLLRTISFIVLKIMCRHISAVATCVKESDLPFLMRIALQASLPSVPTDLRSDAETLMNTLASNTPSFSREAYEKQAMEETCPACGLVVRLENGSDGSCPSGHTWGRCSVTTFILSTPNVRTCVGCTRKAFLPLSSRSSASVPNWLPSSAQSWLVEELLESISRCLFCGNTFSSVL